jgi:hypothetical protein
MEATIHHPSLTVIRTKTLIRHSILSGLKANAPIMHAESDGDPGFEFAPDSGVRTKSDRARGYFLLLFVAMILAIRNPGLGMASRTELIQLAFSVFFEYMQKDPKCSWTSNISQSNIEGFKRKTLWTHSMCRRARNI